MDSILTIDQIFEMLDWNNDKKTQLIGIEKAKTIINLSVLFQPIEKKSVWENCAIVISSKTNEQLKPYVISMFEWLQDMNWPGADIVFKRLLEMPLDMIQLPYNIVLDTAKKMGDYVWLEVLKDFIEMYKL
ncbi:MAG: DUF5071 domain-containing protein [Clostridia bacterium]|nr:DUF5071 domain-containing protein [Clostridia bacterium]